MSPRNYHQIECQQDRETEREIRSCRIDHHQLTLCPLPRWRVDCWCYKSSFISKERAQCVLYSAPMLDLIETWAAGGSQQYLNLTDSSWNWSLVMSDAAINSCCPQIGCCVVIRLQHHYQTFNHQSLEWYETLTLRWWKTKAKCRAV